MHFVQLLEVNFYSYARVRFQKDVRDNAIGWTLDKNHDCLFVHSMSVLKIVLVLRHDQAIEPIVYDCQKSLFDQEMEHSSSAETTSNTF